jgi:hypothetical protein
VRRWRRILAAGESGVSAAALALGLGAGERHGIALKPRARGGVASRLALWIRRASVPCLVQFYSWRWKEDEVLNAKAP